MHANQAPQAVAPALGALLFCVMAALPGAAAAQADQTTQQIVSTRDLDLSTDAGSVALRHRLAVAALKACKQADFSATNGDAAMEGCRMQAMRGASAQADLLVAGARTRGMVSAMSMAERAQP